MLARHDLLQCVKRNLRTNNIAVARTGTVFAWLSDSDEWIIDMEGRGNWIYLGR